MRRGGLRTTLACLLALAAAPGTARAQGTPGAAPAPAPAQAAPPAVTPTPPLPPAVEVPPVAAPAPAVAAAAVAPADGPVPDALASYSAGLDWLFQGWPGMGRLAGLARVELSAVVSKAGVASRIRIHAERARLDGLDLGVLDLQAVTAERATIPEITIRIDGPAGRVQGTLRAAVRIDPATGQPAWDAGPLEGRLDVTGLRLDRLSDAWPIRALGGTADGSLALSGTPERPSLQGLLEARDVTWRGEPVGATRVAWAHADETTDLDVRLGAADTPLATVRLRVPLALDLRAGTGRWKDDGEHRVEIAAHHLTEERARPFWRAPGGVAFRADLDLKGGGTLDRLDVAGTLSGELRTPKGGTVPFHGKATVQAGHQGFTFDLGDGLAKLGLDARIPLVAVRRSGQAVEPSPLSGSLDLALPLPVLAPFLPDGIDDPVGVVRGKIAIAGTAGTPALTGRLETRDATATLLPLNRRLQDLAAVVTVAGDQWTLESFQGKTGPGKATGQGTLRFTPTAPGNDPAKGLWGDWRLEGKASMTLKDFPVVHPDLNVGKAQAVIDVEGKARPGETTATVGLAGGDVFLTSEKVPKASAIPTNPGVRVTDWLRRDVTQRSFLAGEGHLVLEVLLRDPLRVKGEGVDLTMGGRMVLDRQGPVVRVNGGLDVIPGGTFKLFKNKFEVRRGILTLAEGRLDRKTEAGAEGTAGATLADPDRPPEARPLEPILDFVARGRVVDTYVLVKVAGPGARPQLVLASVPALPEYQILTLLIVGRVDVVDDRGGEVRREAAALVNRFHNPGLKRQLFDTLGVDNLGLGFASITQPVLTVGKQITRQLYVESVYHANAPPGKNNMTGHVQYRVDPRWTLDTSFGDAGEGGIGVFWGTTFGGPPLPPPPDDTWGLTDRTRTDRDGDGIEDPFDLCPDQKEDFDGFQDEDGCPDPDNDQDGIPDGRDQAMNEPETWNGFEDDDGRPDTAPPELQGLEARLRPFPYPAGEARLDAAGEAALKAAALVIRGLPKGVRVEVQGHADPEGADATNLAVSRARAQWAKQRLQVLGVRNRRVDAVGFGATQPVDTGDTPEARERNRRIEIKLYYERM